MMDATAAGIPLSAAAGSHVPEPRSPKEQKLSPNQQQLNAKPNQVGTVMLYGIPIVSLVIENQERLCLAQISNTLLKEFSYNEIHNRRVALGITCVQCTPVQLEILRRAGAMPVSSRRCGMITRREAERLCKSFLGDNTPPRLPEDFAFSVHHECAWGCRGAFLPARYNSSRAKCIKCSYCGLFFSPNKFIFHSHRTGPTAKYVQPDAANFNSWRRHMKLSGSPPEEVVHAWEDVKAMFNGGTRKRLLASAAVVQNHQTPSTSSSAATSSVSSGPSPAKLPKLSQDHHHPLHHAAPSATSLPSITPFSASSPPAPHPAPPTPRVPPFSELPVLPLSRSLVMDYVWHHSSAAAAAGSIKHHQFPFPPYAAAAALPWLATAAAAKRGNPFIGFGPGSVVEEAGLQLGAAGADSKLYPSAFRPVYPVLAPTALPPPAASLPQRPDLGTSSDNDEAGSAEPDADQEEEEETVDIETTEEDVPPPPAATTPRPSPAGNESPTCWTPIVPRKDQELSNEEPPSADDAASSVEEKSEASHPQESERLWAVARLSLERQDRVLYRQEVARHLHIMRGAQGALSKMALDCSTCHQLYSGAAVLPSDTKISP